MTEHRIEVIDNGGGWAAVTVDNYQFDAAYDDQDVDIDKCHQMPLDRVPADILSAALVAVRKHLVG